ncbi:MAG: hypothetical protein L3K23_04735 [Thermoplasmata archaeon]|nr:hypothetical protein [Thermoplasmata archaeon]
MASCPACGESTDPGEVACPRCHLAVELFEVVREAAAGEGSDRRSAETVRELLLAAGVDDPPPATSGDSPAPAAQLGQSGSFPAPTSWPDRPRPTPGAARVPLLPALPTAGEIPVLKRQIDEYLGLGRRQGLDFTEFHRRAREALVTDDRRELEALSRDLFVHLAAALVEELQSVGARRNELQGLVATSTPDAELEGCRAALGVGDLAGAHRRLRHLEEELTRLEDEWATVQILVAECDLIAGVVRELGGDPAPALGPLEVGRSLAREGRREEAEPILARAAAALWSVASPMIVTDLRRLASEVGRQRASAVETGPAVEELREFAGALRRRNYGAAVQAYRRLRDRVGPVPASPAPSNNAGPVGPA